MRNVEASSAVPIVTPGRRRISSRWVSFEPDAPADSGGDGQSRSRQTPASTASSAIDPIATTNARTTFWTGRDGCTISSVRRGAITGR